MDDIIFSWQGNRKAYLGAQDPEGTEGSGQVETGGGQARVRRRGRNAGHEEISGGENPQTLEVVNSAACVAWQLVPIQAGREA